MLHSHSPSQRTIGFDHDAVRSTCFSDSLLGIERMHLDLVDRWLDARVRGYQLLNLQISLQHILFAVRTISGSSHMADTVITDTAASHFTVLDRILYSLPASQSRFLATVRRMQQEEINIA